jgi:hypothetical protein
MNTESSADPNCRYCRGSYWVCGKHTDLPMDHIGPHGECDEPGVRCRCTDEGKRLREQGLIHDAPVSG